MKPIKVNLFGMELEEWKYGGSVARFAVGENGHSWAILYDIESEHYGLGHWWESVAKPPFAPSVTTLYKRG